MKILHYEADSSKLFPSTDIKGGVVITYHDETKKFGTIGIFTPYELLNSILNKVKKQSDFKSISSITVSSYAYHFTERLYDDHPELKGCLSKGHDYDLKSNVFDKLPSVFYDVKPETGEKYIQILGREGNSRAYKFIRRDYINDVINLDKYKLFLPKAIGTGKFGETLSTPVLAMPATGSTETYLSIGAFNSMEETKAAKKYISSKFTRALLGILKKTQDVTPEKWKYVPLQDFTASSDIDWSQSVADIDKQLYRKYDLDDKEIAFIETHVKEMK